ncbi:MAG: hypothetical protein E7628_04595 [Ruminococcaceae bacterium]|nr:hypothetical protein [Oscillospiraceae bacterium]
MKKTSNNRGRILSLILAALLLASCSKTGPAKISDSSGVGRDPELVSGYTPDTSETDTPPETDDTSTTPPSPSVENPYEVGSTAWELVNGKYTYYFGPRDESGLATIGEMYTMERKNLPDQPAGYDWFYAHTSYNEATGEVTPGSWDRYDSTIEFIEKYGGIYRGDETQKVCYLTFDCGYEYGTTSQILDVLKEKNAPAIFFVTGHYVEEQYDLMKRMLDEGHLIGNHTVNHWKMSEVTVDQFMQQLNDLEAMYLEKFPDAPPMHYFRPPSGSCNEWSFIMADKMGYKTVMWSWTYYDYDTNNQLPVAEALAKAKNALHPGVVYLFHAESQTNADMLGDLIDWIRAQGYEIMPICSIETQSANSSN